MRHRVDVFGRDMEAAGHQSLGLSRGHEALAGARARPPGHVFLHEVGYHLVGCSFDTRLPDETHSVVDHGIGHRNPPDDLLYIRDGLLAEDGADRGWGLLRGLANDVVFFIPAGVFDDDLEALVFKLQQKDLQDFYQLDTINVQCGDGEFATASIKLISGSKEEGDGGNCKVHAATGNGPVDALYQAIQQSVDIEFEVSDYKISNKGSGEDGLGQADLVIIWQGRNFHGYGLETDVIEASGQALIHALNSIHRAMTIADMKQTKQELER